MHWTVPGTTLSLPREEACQLEYRLSAMFLGGGIQLSQVKAISGASTYDIQNWVKRGFLSPPVKKRYDLNQLCRILTINALRSALSLEQICKLLSYVNGQLADPADDVIDDRLLYFLFVRLAANARELYIEHDRELLLEQAMSDYREPVPGARQKVRNALCLMLSAYFTACMRQETNQLLKTIEKENVQ